MLTDRLSSTLEAFYILAISIMRATPSPSMYYECAITDPTSNGSVRKGRVTKAIRERRERRKTMAMLQRMVPTAKADDSPLQLLLHVMEYISALTVSETFIFVIL